MYNKNGLPPKKSWLVNWNCVYNIDFMLFLVYIESIVYIIFEQKS